MGAKFSQLSSGSNTILVLATFVISLFLLVSSESHKDSVEKEVHICLRKGN